MIPKSGQAMAEALIRICVELAVFVKDFARLPERSASTAYGVRCGSGWGVSVGIRDDSIALNPKKVGLWGAWGVSGWTRCDMMVVDDFTPSIFIEANEHVQQTQYSQIQK